MGVDEGLDAGDQLLGAGERAAPYLASGQNSEPAFDLVEPGTVGRREVETDIGMASQPAIVLGLVCL